MNNSKLETPNNSSTLDYIALLMHGVCLIRSGFKISVKLKDKLLKNPVYNTALTKKVLYHIFVFPGNM